MKKIVFQNNDTADFEIKQVADKGAIEISINRVGDKFTSEIYIFSNDEIPDLIKALKEMAGIE